MKKSNRLILLVGVVLAAVAFVAIVFLFSSGGGSSNQGQNAVPTELPTVIASVDIPLGTQVRSDMLTVKTVAVADRAADAVQEPSPVIGQIVRTNVVAGAQITRSMFAVSSVGLAPGPLLAKGLRAQSVQVDQVTGVGTLINVGDRVDAVVGFGGGGCGASFPVVTVDPTTDTVTPVAGLSSITVKLLLQNMQVVSTLLPPVTTTDRVQWRLAGTRHRHHPERSAGDRGPRGHGPAVRDHQVRPDRRLYQPRAPVAEGLHRRRREHDRAAA